jgi:hypothetical protein
MATLTQVFARGQFSTVPNTSIYTVPANTEAAIVTNLIVTNTSVSPGTFTIIFDGVEMFKDTPIDAKSTISIDMKQPIISPDGEVTGSASSTDIKIHMSGVWVL